MKYFGVRKITSTGRRRTKAEITDSYYSIYKVRCKCSHSVFMPYGVDKKICSHCGNYVYRNKECEFKEKLLKKLKENQICMKNGEI